MRRYEIGAQHGYKTEEQENEQVSESPVTVRIASKGVFHRTADGCEAQQAQADPVHAEDPAETHLDHRQSENHAQHHEEADQAFHLRYRQVTPVQSVRRALPVGGVRAMQHVPQFVAEIGQDLETDGRQDQEDHREPLDLVIRDGQQGAQQDTGQRQRQGTEPHRTDGGNEFTHCCSVLGRGL